MEFLPLTMVGSRRHISHPPLQNIVRVQDNDGLILVSAIVWAVRVIALARQIFEAFPPGNENLERRIHVRDFGD
jgi:hypothetical protein